VSSPEVELRDLTEGSGPGVRVVAITGALVKGTVPDLRRALDARVRSADVTGVEVDLSGVEQIDSAGVALFQVALEQARARGKGLRVTGWSATAEAAFRQVPEHALVRQARVEPPLLERLGATAMVRWQRFIMLLSLTADTFILTFGGARRTARVRRGAATYEAVRIGVDAMPIVSLIAFLVGVVVALQAAYQLAQFGASIYVANLIAVSMTREMGPLMTAIMIAGRSGAAIAAEIATMKVSEEVDALRSMGLDPVRYSVVPKLIGITITFPLLVCFANLLGIFGGYLVSVIYLDIGSQAYWSQVGDALVLKDVLTGLVKSVFFAWIIVILAAHRGYLAEGGAESVGLVTTESVVAGIFWVIVADAAFSLIFYFGG